MEQESTYNPKIAIIGAGPAGCMCAIGLENCDVTIFDINEPLKTLLPTGGGRCNFAHSEYDFKELAKNYPRGEKFLYSVFSKFSTTDTLDFFQKIGVEYYTQDDGRIFPKTNSAKDVRNKMLKQIKTAKFVKEKVVDLKKEENKFVLKTSLASYNFDIVVIAIGTHFGTEVLKNLPHKLIELRPALCGLRTKDNFSTLKGVALKEIILNYKKVTLKDDMIFTDNGISGPLIFKFSSINSKENFPYSIKLNFVPENTNLENAIKLGKNKELKTILHTFLPKSFVKFFLEKIEIPENIKCNELQSNTKVLLLERVHSFETEIIGTRKGGETVFSGGIDLKEIGSNFESKHIENLYFCGEILDIDGFCGGYNLQNCWSSGALTASNILKSMIRHAF